jgi:hypothetical protein
MHDRYLRECRLKLKDNDSYEDLRDAAAADMNFCDRAAAVFDTHPNEMLPRLRHACQLVMERGAAGTDINQQRFKTGIECNVQEFERRAAEGKHFIP